MKKIIIILIVLTVGFISCKKSDVYTNEEQARDNLYELMNGWYLWNKEMPADLTLSGIKDPYELMDTLRYHPLDRWSFVADYKTFMASMQGTFVGHGFRIGVDPQGKARIVTIYKNSPLYSSGTNINGVRRGWIVKTINDKDPAPIIIAKDAIAYNDLIGPAVTDRINTFVFQTPRGNDTTVVSAKKSFQVNSVMLYDTLTLKNGLTGHLVFDEFIEPSSAELKTAFAFFKAQNVKDLILDLRYNSGGILNVATELASYIAGTEKFGTPFVASSFNADKASENNATTNFVSVSYPLNLKRLVIITTKETASASEVIINGLKPHLAVTTIGETTDGKPTGMNVSQYNYTYIFAPITFKLVNSSGQGDFYDGFAPAKYVSDDITHDFNNKNELCFKEAIYFLENGVVSSKGTYNHTSSVQYSEKPAWMNNTYVINNSMLKR
jgi:carboxyl-terminal processing protease